MRIISASEFRGRPKDVPALTNVYDQLVRERLQASIECAKAKVKYGEKDIRYLEAFDAYLQCAQVVDELNAKRGKK